MKEHFLRCEVARIFTAVPPFATATLITENYFSSRSFQLKRLWFLLGFVPASPKCCIALTCRMNLSWEFFSSIRKKRGEYTRGSFSLELSLPLFFFFFFFLFDALSNRFRVFYALFIRAETALLSAPVIYGFFRRSHFCR